MNMGIYESRHNEIVWVVLANGQLKPRLQKSLCRTNIFDLAVLNQQHAIDQVFIPERVGGRHMQNTRAVGLITH